MSESSPEDSRAGYEMSAEQRADEDAKRAVSSTLNYITDAVQQAKNGREVALAAPDCAYIASALRKAIEELEATHKKLFQQGYFGAAYWNGDQEELF